MDVSLTEEDALNNNNNQAPVEETTAHDLTVQDEHLLLISFINQSWLDRFQFNVHTVLDYFRTSQFWTNSCNNEILMMQGRPMSQLKSMVGVEYEVQQPKPQQKKHCFIIKKQLRRSPEFVELLQLYYIVSEGEQGVLGTIYQLPDMSAVVRCNVDAAMHWMQHVVAALADHTISRVGLQQQWRAIAQKERELDEKKKQQQQQQQQQQPSSSFSSSSSEQEIYDRIAWHAFQTVLSKAANEP